MRYTDLRQSNLTVELLVMGVIASSFFIHGSDPRDVCLMATLYPPWICNATGKRDRSFFRS